MEPRMGSLVRLKAMAMRCILVNIDGERVGFHGGENDVHIVFEGDVVVLSDVRLRREVRGPSKRVPALPVRPMQQSVYLVFICLSKLMPKR
eukprot:scaffold630_cov399-Prasinococcus_capsulatus_cf.AAC.27